MKKIPILIFICLLLSGCFFSGGDFEEDDFITRYEAVTLPINEFENSILVQESKPIIKASKIYIINDFIFINDKRTGFHIFDNSDPSNPTKKKFLKIPGATDIAIRNNILYINQATDLVVLTFNSSTLTANVEKRIKNVFPELRSPDGEINNDEDIVVIDWIEK